LTIYWLIPYFIHANIPQDKQEGCAQEGKAQAQDKLKVYGRYVIFIDFIKAMIMIIEKANIAAPRKIVAFVSAFMSCFCLFG
jgi:hypothetical protein